MPTPAMATRRTLMQSWRRIELVFWSVVAMLLLVAVAALARWIQTPNNGRVVGAAVLGIICAVLWRAWMRRKVGPLAIAH